MPKMKPQNSYNYIFSTALLAAMRNIRDSNKIQFWDALIY